MKVILIGKVICQRDKLFEMNFKGALAGRAVDQVYLVGSRNLKVGGEYICLVIIERIDGSKLYGKIIKDKNIDECKTSEML